MNMLVKHTPKTNLMETFFNDSLFNDLIFNDYDFNLKNNLQYDVIETEKEYSINMLLAGYNKEDFNLNIDDGKLTVSGERVENNDLKYNYKNSYYGKFSKTFTLPKNVLLDKVDAEYVNGVLKINIPKDKDKISKKSIVIR